MKKIKFQTLISYFIIGIYYDHYIFVNNNIVDFYHDNNFIYIVRIDDFVYLCHKHKMICKFFNFIGFIKINF
jgi:hypothetical protein